MTAPILLTDAQMQAFVADGYLCLKTTLPESFHDDIYARFDELIGGDANQNPGNNLLPAVPALQAVFDDPAVRGALTSVLGPDYVMHPHRALHNNVPGSEAQNMHKDSYWGYTRRVRNHRPRWVMVMYVPQATPVERGPTGVVPGSQYQVQRPDEDLMPEVPGCLEAGGFLLIHYDIWHRKMKNFTDQKRFMMKFEFIRMDPRPRPSWDHKDDGWAPAAAPPVDMTAVWRRQWDWLCGKDGSAAGEPLAAAEIDRVLAALDDPDPKARLAGLNRLAGDPGTVTAQLDRLGAMLGDPCEPVAIDAAYALAAAGPTAVEPLLRTLAADDADEVGVNRSSEQGGEGDPALRARNAAYALTEIGEPAVPGLLELLRSGKGRARKLAAFALGEIGANAPEVTPALCAAARDADVLVRINAVEALGLMPADPAAVEALGAAMKDEDQQVRFSAALSLAQLGPKAEAAVPALGTALHDENRYVPGYAVEALERIATPDALRTLLPFLKTARWCQHTTPKSIY